MEIPGKTASEIKELHEEYKRRLEQAASDNNQSMKAVIVELARIIAENEVENEQNNTI